MSPLQGESVFSVPNRRLKPPAILCCPFGAKIVDFLTYFFGLTAGLAVLSGMGIIFVVPLVLILIQQVEQTLKQGGYKVGFCSIDMKQFSQSDQ